ncbi:hypothetical protein F750_3898 [Streptomyces sp. PAMC 26508]|nr:hypothetical protein F750_3898 [Streptomyces sp. PAMC 26508]
MSRCSRPARRPMVRHTTWRTIGLWSTGSGHAGVGGETALFRH